jgi:hypothetical protein
MAVYRSSPVANPHPLRPQELCTGRSEVSKKRPFDLIDFVDVEKAKRVFPVSEQELVDFAALVPSFPMFLNDQWGDCTCAGAAHMEQVFAALVKLAFTVSDADVQRMYEASGFRPGDPSTDQGWTLEAAAEYLQKTGLQGKPNILTSANVSLSDDDAQQVALELFGGLYEGCIVSQGDMRAFQEGKPWEPNNTPEAGGHCITRPRSRLRKSGGHVTWGSVQEATEAWEKEKVDELRVFVPVDWQAKLPEELVDAGIVDFGKLESLVAQYG